MAVAEQTKTQAPTTLPANENPLAKFDPGILKAIQTTAAGVGPAAFLPANMAEAMELAKLMASSNFVPPHLRGKAGDCLAVVMQARNWNADPFAVASKTYFVNDHIAYESQLIVAVINTLAPLDNCRLRYEFDGEGEKLFCRVSAKLRGDPEIKIAEQRIASITVRNSPLWKSSPDQQLGYYTARKWARRHCPEVLLGIYTPEEMEEAILDRQPDGSYAVAPGMSLPARPTRAQFQQPTTAGDSNEDMGSTESDAGSGAQAEEQTEDADYTLISAIGEVIAEGLSEMEFGIKLAELIGAVTELKALQTLWENNGEAVAALQEGIRNGVTSDYDKALMALKPRSGGAKQQSGKLV